jgi:GNAT superfamily N-acetyltransferase
MTSLRVMSAFELSRIAEVDRSERITQQYRQIGEMLEVIDVDIDAPRWGAPGELTIQQRIEEWTRLVNSGGILIGAFDEDNFIGFAIYLRASPETPANLAVLHVTKPWRHHGIGRALTNEIVRLARVEGTETLYVSATPTRQTVDFYLNQGFMPLRSPHRRLFALEPDDIHMERVL